MTFNNLELIKYLSENSIKKLNNYPELENFLLKKLYPPKSFFGYEESFSYNDKFFDTLLTIPNINKNPEIFYGLDRDQLFIRFIKK